MTKWHRVLRFYKYCARLFKTYRKKQKLTIEQLAEDMKMSPDWVRDIETGVRDINLLDVVVITTFFNIDSGQLLRNGGL